MTKQTKTLIERWFELKPKLEKARAELEADLMLCEQNQWTTFEKIIKQQMRLNYQALELLRDTFNGEEIDIT